MPRKKAEPDWVVTGGRIGELGHCTRCGEGLVLNLPQHIEVVAAAMKAFASVHHRCEPGQYKEPTPKTPAEWVRSRDTGVSSCTIYAVMTGEPTPMHGFGIPHDSSDFGRCFRLIQLFPEWRARLPEVAKKFSAWGPFVRDWDELAALYEREAKQPDPQYPLYQKIRNLVTEGKDKAVACDI